MRAVPARRAARLRLEVPELPAHVFEQHLRHVAREAFAHHGALDDDVLQVPRQAVGGHLPAAVAQPVGEVEQRVVGLAFQRPREDGQVAAVAQQLAGRVIGG
jgi:hypothetical protein